MKGPKPYRNMRLIGESEAEAKPEPKPAKLEPPAWLDDGAREIYREKATQIQAAGYWDERFSDALALLATLLTAHRRDPAGLSAAKTTQLRLLLSELGLTPQSARGVTK
jgi:phage terminase small subunit